MSLRDCDPFICHSCRLWQKQVVVLECGNADCTGCARKWGAQWLKRNQLEYGESLFPCTKCPLYHVYPQNGQWAYPTQPSEDQDDLSAALETMSMRDATPRSQAAVAAPMTSSSEISSQQTANEVDMEAVEEQTKSPLTHVSTDHGYAPLLGPQKHRASRNNPVCMYHSHFM